MPAPGPLQPRLILQSLHRGDGLLGLRPCGPVIRPARTPLFGARGPLVTVVRLHWQAPDGRRARPATDSAAHTAAVQRLQRTGLRRLPAEALQWRGASPLAADDELWTLVQESQFGDFWADELPVLQQEGWSIVVLPGFAHQSVQVEAWQLVLNPVSGEGDAHQLAAPPGPRAPRLQALQSPPGMGSWLLSLGVVVDGETLDLVPLLAGLIKRDRRWLQREQIDAIADDALIRLRTPAGRHIDAPAAPLKAIARTLLELLTEPRRRDGALQLAQWEAHRLETLRLTLATSAQAAPGSAGAWAMQGDAGLQQLAMQLQAAGPERDVAPPHGLGITLRDYQQQGLAWLQHLRRQSLGGILADDMGLGKTAQALAHLLLEKQAGRLDRPALVVAPASLIFNWQAELDRVAPDLSLLIWHGSQRTKDAAAFAAHDVVLTAYPLLWRDDGLLRRQHWHLVILDEAQVVKNAGSRTATAARRLDARHRLCLTGTPIENHLGELWAQFHFLMPGFLGDARQFQRRWRTPIERNGETLRAELLAQRVRPFILRRRKDDVATELPPLTEQLQRVRLEGAQRVLYESVRFAADEQVRRLLDRIGFKGAQIGILDALLKLRQVCCDPRLVKNRSDGTDADSAKLAWLRELLPQLVAEGRRVLLFSQFTEWLALLQPELDALQLPWLSLTGEVPTAQRGALVRRFQAGEVPLLLASLKAGGVGLNLTAADTVIHLDPWWNPAVERQASARAHRIGQHKPVLVYRLVAEGSIEERLLALQMRKTVLADSVLGHDGAASLKFSEDDLHGLLAPLR
ncbi:DEAD/DEAH box helicase [Aquabacterium sp.]|uniref:DEAD/DEAH box helicase n=1 Tax=Aquabacterium sp. TaxID=1872578 RepID=UPI002CF41F97|nr:DEAD/DEAH box helicase [Aquabacterium sp.]HSW08540.1 DEAD/DEAH box helicase [Aquabacterium sp.]